MMADKTATTYSQKSNRERPREAPERKVVFKSVLDNPFRIPWPSVPVNLQNVVLSQLSSLLDGASSYHQNQVRASRKRKREAERDGSIKKRKLSDAATMAEPSDASLASDLISLAKPDILNHLVCGINAVTKRLEAQARQVRRITALSTLAEGKQEAPISLVFVCRADIDPPILIDHLPPLVAACNSVHTTQHVKMVPLPKGSETTLADKLGFKRASVIALDIEYTGLANLLARLESIPALTAPWLMQQAKSQVFISTHVKQLRTSVPKDMNAAKKARVEGKLAAKATRVGQSLPST